MFNLKVPTKQMKIEMQFSISLDDMYFNSMAIKRFGDSLLQINVCPIWYFFFNEIRWEMFNGKFVCVYSSSSIITFFLFVLFLFVCGSDLFSFDGDKSFICAGGCTKTSET